MLPPYLGSDGMMGYRTFSPFGQQSLKTSISKALKQDLSPGIPGKILASGSFGPSGEVFLALRHLLGIHTQEMLSWAEIAFPCYRQRI